MTEGWGGRRWGRLTHYYRYMESLCRQGGFYAGVLEIEPAAKECKKCRRRLDKENTKRGEEVK